MTQIITRYFDDAARAQAVTYELVDRQRFPRSIVHLYDTAEGLSDTLTAAHVDAKTAKTYQDRMKKGGAVLLIQAGYKPLNVARIARQTMAEMGASEIDGVEEVSVKEVPNLSTSVLQYHPRFMTRTPSRNSKNHYMADWPIPLISRRKPFSDSLFGRHKRMANWPIPLIDRRKPFTGSIIGRHARMANFPIPLLSQRKPFTGSIFGRHARMANFPIPLLSRRQPKNRSAIGRHTRMANWPFPLLIDGKSSNSLIPGSPHQAAYPIPLLSGRKPFTGSIFGRHARMASFPISLLSKRKPFTGSMIETHGRMADRILPLVLKEPEDKDQSAGNGAFFSKYLKLQTIIHR